MIILIVLYSLFNFAIDYLSNTLITHNELTIGIVTLLHHFIHTIFMFLPLLLLTFNNNVTLIILSLLFLVGETLWVINKDFCFITTFQNTLISEEYKYYKWISGLSDFIKKYIRGDEWAYSNIHNLNKNFEIIFVNTVFVLYCLKSILININVN